MVFNKYNWKINEDGNGFNNISITLNNKKYTNLTASSSCYQPGDNFDLRTLEKFINSSDELMNDEVIKSLYEKYKNDKHLTLEYEEFKKCITVEKFLYDLFNNESHYFIIGLRPNIVNDYDPGWAIQYNYNGEDFQHERIGPASIAFGED